MSSRSIVRLSICSLCGIAMLLCGLTESLLAQKVPPALPVPQLQRPGGNQDKAHDDDRDGNRRGNSTGRRKPNFSSAESSFDKAKPKFEELLADKDLSRFRGYQDEEIGDGWEIDGKYLHFDGSTDSGDIITVDEYDNFELQFDYKVSEGGNSGVMYRVSLGDDHPYLSGPEYQVLDDENHADGNNKLTSAGSLYAMYAPENKRSRKSGTWNDVRIIVNGNSVKHYLNGVKVVEAEIGSDDWNDRLEESKFKDWEKFGKNSKGHIAFQDHGDEVWYRNIRIKQLTPKTAASDRSSRSDSSGVSRAQPPSRSGRTTRSKPRFYAEGSGLDPKKGDDKADKRDRDDNDNNRANRSDARDSSRARPPSRSSTRPTRSKPRFYEEGSGLDSKKDKDKDDDDDDDDDDDKDDDDDDDDDDDKDKKDK